jgi:hypothetical protein
MIKMNRLPIHLAVLGWLLTGLFACDSSEPDDEGVGEQEFITRVLLTFNGGGETITAEANDPDGDGTEFEVDTIVLTAGVSYSATTQVFDDINGENITEEIEDEAEEHQFFYTPGGGISGRVTVTVRDTDVNGLPVGLEFDLDDSGDQPAGGTLRVILSHYDEEPKNGTDRSDETDVDVTFPVTIE